MAAKATTVYAKSRESSPALFLLTFFPRSGDNYAAFQAYTGDRLRNTLDWSLSSVGEDVTAYTERLTEMERRLFLAGAKASAQQFRWKVHGFSRRAGRGQLRQQPVLSTALPQHHGGGALEAASSSPDRDSRWGKRPRTR
jgi:hypothetical protein